MGKASHYDDYTALFHSPTASELQQQFADIVGDTYESLPPSLSEAFGNVDTSDTGFNEEAQKICDSSLLDSMTLDQVTLLSFNLSPSSETYSPSRLCWQLILSCIFTQFESSCNFLPLELSRTSVTTPTLATRRVERLRSQAPEEATTTSSTPTWIP